MKTDVSARFIARAIGLTERAVQLRLVGRPSQKRNGRGGGREYAIDSLPAEWRAPVAAAVMREARTERKRKIYAAIGDVRRAVARGIAAVMGRP